MGSFYVNYTICHTDAPVVAKALAGRSAFVTPAQNGCVVAYDAESDNQDQAIVMELGLILSSELECAVLAVLNHDDDLLWYQLFSNGDIEDEYDSSPGILESDSGGEIETPSGGDARKLCATFRSNAAAKVQAILSDTKNYVFALERHAALVRALGLPEFAVGFGYKAIQRRKIPKGLKESDLIRVS
ncbi:MAG TPA: hypothetical protein VGO67_22950 [Verrucomicrobiae bacterium]|jgi:hypothetical protein